MSLMNAHVAEASDAILQIYVTQRASLKSHTTPQLVELEHEMEHLRLHPDFSIRAGAEIVRAAAVLERESRT